MKPIQWIFHYIEISEMSSEESEALMDSLQDIELSLSLMTAVINPESGKRAIDSVMDFKKKREDERKKVKNKDSGDEEDITKNSNYVELSDSDQELLEFMYAQPEVIEENNEMKNVGRFILPTVNRKDIEQGAKVVNKIEKKPKLGF